MPKTQHLFTENKGVIMKKTFLPLLGVLAIGAHAACGLEKNASDEYLVQSFSDLQKVGTGDCALDAKYRLAKDIEASSDPFPAIGDATTPFTGEFHGAGHVIKKLAFKPYFQTSGMFYQMDGLVDSLGLENVKSNATALGAGAFVAFDGEGKLSNVYATGAVALDAATGNAGGLAASFSGTIEDSYFNGSVHGGDNIGGIVGYNYGTVSKSYAINTYEFTSFTFEVSFAGIAGTNEGVVKNCYASFFPVNIAKTDLVREGTAAEGGKAFAAYDYQKGIMKKKSSFSDWKFNDAWIIYDEQSLPLLQAFLTKVTVSAEGLAVSYCSNKISSDWKLKFTPNIEEGSVGGSARANVTTETSSDGTVSTATIDASGLYSVDQHGYLFVGATLNVPVIPETLKITGISIENKTYDGTVKATIKGEPKLEGVCEDDDVQLAGIGIATFENEVIGKDKKVEITGYSLVGDEAALANYTLSLPALTASITEDTETIRATPRNLQARNYEKFFNIRGEKLNRNTSKHVRKYAK